jgi:hypothetical protein
VKFATFIKTGISWKNVSGSTLILKKKRNYDIELDGNDAARFGR